MAMKILMTCFFVFALFPVFGQGHEKNFIDQNYIEVEGKAQMEIVPDLIYLKIVLSEKDTKNRIALSELENKMTGKLQEIGVDVKKDLSVDDFSSYFRNKIISKAEIILTKEYQLVVHDSKTVAKIFFEFEKIGISNVNVDRLDHSKITEFRKEVKVNAIKAAKDKAEYLAKAIGQDIGRAIYVQELDNEINYNTANQIARNRGVSRSYYYDESKQLVDIDFDKIKLEYSILTRFELK
jgi:uncharacterized protein